MGILISRILESRGQKPSVRADLGMCSVGFPFFMFGGQCAKLTSDVRKFHIDGNAIEWKILRTDVENNLECSQRHGHSLASYG